MFGALKHGFRSMASLILVRNVVGELQRKRTLAASRGFLAAARLSCLYGCHRLNVATSLLFNLCLKYGYLSYSFMHSTVNPIVKCSRLTGIRAI